MSDPKIVIGRSNLDDLYIFAGMNRTEEAYGKHLQALHAQQQIAAWGYEPVRLRLAWKTYYTPDFMVIRPNGTIEFHEVKGHWREDARVKLKTAATIYPFFHFWAVTMPKSGMFEYEDIPPASSVNR